MATLEELQKQIRGIQSQQGFRAPIGQQPEEQAKDETRPGGLFGPTSFAGAGWAGLNQTNQTTAMANLAAGASGLPPAQANQLDPNNAGAPGGPLKKPVFGVDKNNDGKIAGDEISEEYRLGRGGGALTGMRLGSMMAQKYTNPYAQLGAVIGATIRGLIDPEAAASMEFREDEAEYLSRTEADLKIRSAQAQLEAQEQQNEMNRFYNSVIQQNLGINFNSKDIQANTSSINANTNLDGLQNTFDILPDNHPLKAVIGRRIANINRDTMVTNSVSDVGQENKEATSGVVRRVLSRFPNASNVTVQTNSKGEVLGISVADAQGRVQVFDRDGNPLKGISVKETALKAYGITDQDIYDRAVRLASFYTSGDKPQFSGMTQEQVLHFILSHYSRYGTNQNNLSINGQIRDIAKDSVDMEKARSEMETREKTIERVPVPSQSGMFAGNTAPVGGFSQNEIKYPDGTVPPVSAVGVGLVGFGATTNGFNRTVEAANKAKTFWNRATKTRQTTGKIPRITGGNITVSAKEFFGDDTKGVVQIIYNSDGQAVSAVWFPKALPAAEDASSPTPTRGTRRVR